MFRDDSRVERQAEETVVFLADFLEAATANLEFSVLGRVISINTTAALQVLFFKMLEFLQLLKADLIGQIG